MLRVQVTVCFGQDETGLMDCPECPEMIVVSAGSFDMGVTYSGIDALPVHRVVIGYSFEIGRTEVTQGMWKAIMGTSTNAFPACGDDCPVAMVSWSDVHVFIEKLNGKTGKNYRLPSEAEWEFACRAGGESEYCGSSDANEVAWYGMGEMPWGQRIR